jgi:4-hydroxy-tetrahydrodipicolinate reductase
MTLRIGVTGAGGRMGRTLIEAINAFDGMVLAAATERSGSSLLGVDAGRRDARPPCRL